MASTSGGRPKQTKIRQYLPIIASIFQQHITQPEFAKFPTNTKITKNRVEISCE